MTPTQKRFGAVLGILWLAILFGPGVAGIIGLVSFGLLLYVGGDSVVHGPIDYKLVVAAIFLLGVVLLSWLWWHVA